MDTRDSPEQAELRRAARRLARERGPGTVADLDDRERAGRLARAVHDAGWLELRDDAGDGTPLASGVEASILAEGLAGSVADVALTGPLLAADLARRAGATGAATTAVAFGADLLGPASIGGHRTDAPLHVVDAPDGCDSALVLVPGPSELRLGRVAVAPDADGVQGVDLTRRVGTVPAGATVEEVADQTRPLTADDLAAWTALGLALTSADLVGVMRGVLDLSVAYAAERHQFGAPVGSFQAVQHLLAEACCLLEGSVSVALHASWAVDELEPREALAAGQVAKAYCARAARTVCETAVQVHGGIGNTWECMVHVFLRRALLSSQWLGDDSVQLRHLEIERLGVADGLP